MVKVYSKALARYIEVDRIIGHIRGEMHGPTLVFSAGIHGNEPSGIFALYNVLGELRRKNVKLRGSIYALSGNLTALQKGERYINHDLNRLWTKKILHKLLSERPYAHDDDSLQQLDIYHTIKDILKSEKGPFYFMDLHTTSCETKPFLTVNDTILNRKYTSQYPLPIILGIEEYLVGPLLNYINELGYVAFGYEGGQHDALDAIENHESFIYLSLAFSGCINPADIEFDKHYQKLTALSGDRDEFYEIFYRYQIEEQESFKMKAGFKNFQTVKKGTELALSNGKIVPAKKTSLIFMPLYQNQGDDGFFCIRKIPKVFLTLSTVFRKVRLDKLLTLLPGISWGSPFKDTLAVNKKIARFFARDLFHLLGYRGKYIDKDHIIMKSREVASRNDEYSEERWNKK
ncbi:succinylglutamate desuccinylase/aspartoacylase family protein [Fulvivirga sp. 29W222]|uniref:Succinylglutamate desuccinylase/aspartoacylase family protein n=1 Tax=Fulvivirga marina TaxID=2494733 RepID=A0A937G3K8_9BACT|nr:succinylglutamate desuccinylase/aspartoacylase family protein [Fulvivirga marina]MBL6449355.1 succinylglutamate desuccinylase/aspartoacylase family protein [Fulvivirga marina]